MRTIAILPGRFMPPHLGHKSVYDGLVNKFGYENVFIVSSNKQDATSSPLSFDQKKFLWAELGVPPDNIVQVISPYQPKEVTSKFDNTDTAIVFALSEKDAKRFTFKPKKNGDPSYMQPYDEDSLQSLDKTGYVLVVPTIDFKVLGQEIKSASEIRNMYISADDEGRIAILKDLYGKATNTVKNIFDNALKNSISESIISVIREFKEFVYGHKKHSK